MSTCIDWSRRRRAWRCMMRLGRTRGGISEHRRRPHHVHPLMDSEPHRPCSTEWARRSCPPRRCLNTRISSGPGVFRISLGTNRPLPRLASQSPTPKSLGCWLLGWVRRRRVPYVGPRTHGVSARRFTSGEGRLYSRRHPCQGLCTCSGTGWLSSRKGFDVRVQQLSPRSRWPASGCEVHRPSQPSVVGEPVPASVVDAQAPLFHRQFICELTCHEERGARGHRGDSPPRRLRPRHFGR